MINDDGIQRIERLSELKDKGLISVEEFEQAKKEILFGRLTATAEGQQIASLSFPNLSTMKDALRLPFKKYADFRGRSEPREYWPFHFVQVIFITFVVSMGSLFEFIEGDSSLSNAILAIGFLLWGLGTLVPSLAVGVRRLHDQDKSGWFLLMILIPFVGWLIITALMALEGTHGPNRFGEDPREI